MDEFTKTIGRSNLGASDSAIDLLHIDDLHTYEAR